MTQTGKPQTLAEYYEDLEQGAARINAGKFTTAEDLIVETETKDHTNLKVLPGFTQGLCWALTFHLTELFAKSDDPLLSGLWCDGIAMPAIDNHLSKYNINRFRKLVVDAWIGPDGQQKYEMTILFGRKALSRYARDLSLIQCFPEVSDLNWIELDTENHRAILRFK